MTNIDYEYIRSLKTLSHLTDEMLVEKNADGSTSVIIGSVILHCYRVKSIGFTHIVDSSLYPVRTTAVRATLSKKHIQNCNKRLSNLHLYDLDIRSREYRKIWLECGALIQTDLDQHCNLAERSKLGTKIFNLLAKYK